MAFTVYIVLQNVQFVHCALYKSYSLYTPCLRTPKNKCSPLTVYIVVQIVQFVHCTAYTVKIVQFIYTIQYTIHLFCVHLKINVDPLLFTLQCKVYNLYIVHCKNRTVYIQYTPCLCTLKINVVPLLCTL